MIFVDTGAWFALAVREDPDHATAMEFFERNPEPLVTSDQVVIETMNLIRFRNRKQAGLELACAIGDALWEQKAAILLRTEPEDIQQARDLFRRYRDKLWSFTDCTSFALMTRLKIPSAFAFDRNFEQYPGISRLP